MSQHDMVLDNGPGLAVREDMNAAIQALVSTSSGPVEPTVKFPGMLWLDTSVAPDGLLRQRNLANNAWIALRASSTTPGEDIHAAPLKAVPVAADELPISDSASTPTAWQQKRITVASLITSIYTGIAGLAAKATLVDADVFAIGDSAAAFAGKKHTWAQLKAGINTAMAAIYQPLLTGVGIIELGSTLTGDRYTGIDFHSASGGSDYEARLLRAPGVNGSLELVNTGTGGVRAPTPAAGSNDTQIATTAFVTANAGIVQPTTQKATNGVLTFLEWTGIPAGTKRITVEWWNISAATTGMPCVQLGDSGGYEGTLYVSSGGYIQNAGQSTVANIAGAMLMGGGQYNSATITYGTAVIHCMDAANGAVWLSGALATAGSVPIFSGSAKALDGRLDRIKFMLSDNTAMDAGGIVNIQYEQ